MTRKEAGDIIAKIAADEIELFRPHHFWESLNKRGFTLHDLRAILRRHEMESAPE